MWQMLQGTLVQNINASRPTPWMNSGFMALGSWTCQYSCCFGPTRQNMQFPELRIYQLSGFHLLQELCWAWRLQQSLLWEQWWRERSLKWRCTRWHCRQTPHHWQGSDHCTIHAEIEGPIQESWGDRPKGHCLEEIDQKFIRKDYKKRIKQLKLKSTKISQGLRIENDKSSETVFIQGRYGYKAQLVLRSAHQKNHLTSSNRILVRISTSYLFSGGALSYLDKLRRSCTARKRLQPQPIQKEMGEVPRGLRGIQADASSTWRQQSCDLFGPFDCTAFPGQRLGQRHAVSLKPWALLLCHYSTRTVRGAICEDYSADSVIQALRTPPACPPILPLTRLKTSRQLGQSLERRKSLRGSTVSWQGLYNIL